MNAVDPIHITQKHAHPDRFSTPTSSEVVMVYALVNTLPTQGGLGLFSHEWCDSMAGLSADSAVFLVARLVAMIVPSLRCCELLQMVLLDLHLSAMDRPGCLVFGRWEAGRIWDERNVMGFSRVKVVKLRSTDVYWPFLYFRWVKKLIETVTWVCLKIGYIPNYI